MPWYWSCKQDLAKRKNRQYPGLCTPRQRYKAETLLLENSDHCKSPDGSEYVIGCPCISQWSSVEAGQLNCYYYNNNITLHAFWQYCQQHTPKTTEEPSYTIPSESPAVQSGENTPDAETNNKPASEVSESHVSEPVEADNPASTEPQKAPEEHVDDPKTENASVVQIDASETTTMSNETAILQAEVIPENASQAAPEEHMNNEIPQDTPVSSEHVEQETSNIIISDQQNTTLLPIYPPDITDPIILEQLHFWENHTLPPPSADMPNATIELNASETTHSQNITAPLISEKEEGELLSETNQTNENEIIQQSETETFQLVEDNQTMAETTTSVTDTTVTALNSSELASASNLTLGEVNHPNDTAASGSASEVKEHKEIIYPRSETNAVNETTQVSVDEEGTRKVDTSNSTNYTHLVASSATGLVAMISVQLAAALVLML